MEEQVHQEIIGKSIESIPCRGGDVSTTWLWECDEKLKPHREEGLCWEDMEDRTGDKIRKTVLSQDRFQRVLNVQLLSFGSYYVDNLKLNGTGLFRIFIWGWYKL